MTVEAEAPAKSASKDGAELKRTPSQGSMGSKFSKMSKSSLSSKLTGLVKLSANGLGAIAGKSSRCDTSTAEMVDLVVGDKCETVSLVTVRKDESVDSEVIQELPIGSVIEVLEVGEGRRVKISTPTAKGKPNLEGWISSKTRLNEPLVMKVREDMGLGAHEFEVGGQHEVKSSVMVRAEEVLDSEVRCELKPGTIVRILEIGVTNSRRARVSTDSTEGWISTMTRQGELLIGKVEEGLPAQSGGMFSGNSGSKVQNLLEAARGGDIALMKKVAEGGNVMSKFTVKPNLNASDIRGKTALIYAAAFGNKEIVEYLVSRTKEVDVNALDDTQKSALHHASKRAKLRRCATFDEMQGDIVDTLLQAGAYMEARDHNGCTALMFAVANGDEAVTQRLLNANANVNVKDFEGHMPLDYAKNFDHSNMIQILVNAGAVATVESDEEEAEEAAEGMPDAEDAGPIASMLSAAESAPEASPAAAEGATEEGKVAGEEANAPSPSPPEKKEKDEKTEQGKAPEKKPAASAKKKAMPQKDDKKAVAKKKAAPGQDKKKDLGAKKGAAAKKGADKKKVVSGAMAEVVAAEDEEGGVEVQEAPKEEEDDKTRVLRKVAVLMEKVTAPKELEAAVQQAQVEGATEAELQAAQAKIQELKTRQKANENLLIAVSEKDVQKLKEAIKKAEEQKVAKAGIDEAKKVLEVEEPRQKARDKLKEAKSSGDAAWMKTALAEAAKAGVPVEEVKEFEDLLAGAENKEQATKALEQAIAKKDVAGLKFAIQQAKDAGLDAAGIAKADRILKEEEPKQQARDGIAEALQANTVEALKAALDKAKGAKLDVSEYSEVEEMITKKGEQEKLLKQVTVAVTESESANMTDVDSVREAKEKLAQAIASAIAMGVAEADLMDAEIRRKKLHNTVEDLKGSIRVFCRIRPLNKRENDLKDHEITKQTDPMTLVVGEDKSQHTFNFDAVFTPGTQEEIFEDCKDLVQSAVDGYNVTLFAYGQTGAGKTFTMAGVPGMLGVTPRTITELYEVIEKGKSRFNYTVMGSMLELYRQDLVDLLAKGNKAIEKQKLNVRMDKSGMVMVEHLIAEECDTAQKLEDILERGTKCRAVAATAMNSESSRSHLVLIVQIVSVNRETKEQLRGKLLIVDLAGSERLKKSQTTADAQKESIEINKSLTALGDVIEALTKGLKVIPYRNHKLTMLMQDSLGGSAKTLMFVNCSPASTNEDETVMSLKYAQRAKKITNSAKKG